MRINYFIVDMVDNTGYPILPTVGLCFPLLRTMLKCRNYLPGICLNLNFSRKLQSNWVSFFQEKSQGKAI